MLTAGFSFGGIGVAWGVANKVKNPKLKAVLGLGALLSGALGYVFGFKSFHNNAKDAITESKEKHSSEINNLKEQIKVIDEQIKILKESTPKTKLETVG